MEKGPGSHSDTDAPARLASQEVLGDPGAATRAAAPNSSVAAPTQVSQWQETSSLPQPGRDNQRLRTCVQPLPLRPIALESSLASQQRRNQYSGSTNQQLLRSHPGYHFSPGRSPSTPTTNDSPYAPSYSPSVSSVRSEPPGCAGTDFFNRSRADGQAVQVGRLLTGFTRTGVMGLKSVAVGPSTVAVLSEVASGQTRRHVGPRKFSPNIDTSRNGECLTKEESDCSSIANLKEESTAASSSCLGIDEGLLTRTLLQAMQNKSHGPAKAENHTSAKDCSGGVSTGTENGHRPHGHAGKTVQNGTDAPSHLRTSVRIMESNVRLLYQQLRSSKDGRVKKEKKSKDLLELSWVGGDVRDENGTSGLYTPLTLPFVVKEEVEEEEEEHKEQRTPDGEPVQKTRPRRTRRPTARHVEEANRFAAGLLLAEDGPGKSAGRASSDTWDFADDEGRKGVEFLHICFPFAFPPLDRQAMMEAEGLQAQQVRRCPSGSTTDSRDGHACSGTCSCRGFATRSQGQSNSTNFPLQPSPPLRLPELPAGRIGRLLVHRSGRVKLRLLSSNSEGNTRPGCASQPLPRKVVSSATSTTDSIPLKTPSEGVSTITQKSPGETSDDVTVKGGTKCQLSRGGNDRAISFEVNVGSECTFAQDVGCFFRDSSEFVFLGRCNKRLVVAPDIKNWLANTQHTPAALS